MFNPRKTVIAVFFSAFLQCAHQAKAEPPCKAIPLVPGSSRLIHGTAPSGGTPLCYTLQGAKGHAANLTMADGGEHVVFKIADPEFETADDALRTSTFKLKHHSYRIVVFEETAEAQPEPFTLSVSLK